MFAAQSKAILDLAEKGPAVFVGRCSDYVLRGRPRLVNVFVHAPLDARAKRSSERNGTTLESARAWVQKTDDERAVYYQRHTGRIWGSVALYNLSVDTGPIGVENAAELIIDYARMMGYVD